MGLTHQQAIIQFLKVTAKPHMARRYTEEMEVQILVAKGAGQLIVEDIDGRMVRYYKDDLDNIWKDHRIPFGANTDNPIWNDRPIGYDLFKHADSIGMTGWNWVKRQSEFVTFDFDSITNHVKAGLDEATLMAIVKSLEGVDWVTIQRSTSGAGYHVYVEFNPPVPTKNHTEHAALARAILNKLSAMTSRDFNDDVDICGGNIWIWARRQTAKSFEVVKQGVAMDSSHLPINWQDYIQSVTARGAKSTVSVFDADGNMVQDLSGDQGFEDFVRKQNRIPLDKGHEKLFRWLESHGCPYHWDKSRHLMRTHTKHLQTAKMDPELAIIGPFETNTSGTTSINCYCFPHANGVWEVRRYGEKVNEGALWEKMAQGWTRTWFNRLPDLKTICKARGGAAVPNGGGYQFPSLFVAQEVLDAMGVDIKLPPELVQRQTVLKQNEKTGLVEVVVSATRDEQIMGWAKSKTSHILVLEDVKVPVSEMLGSSIEDQVMYLVMADSNYGWAVWNNETGRPEMTSKDNIRSTLYFKAGVSTETQAQRTFGRIISKPWQIVNIPFAEEFLAGRRWNKGAARLALKPSVKDFDSLSFPTWQKILRHLGRSIDAAVNDPSHPSGKWCVENGVKSGYHYLLLWIASMFQHPFEQLPLLFLHSQQQNTGKTTLHEAISLLLKDGVIGAEAALKSQQGFNKEFQGRILAFVEEVDFSKHKEVYNKLKDWITAKTITIHEKNKTPYVTENTTHWIYCSNNFQAIPVTEQDTRITMIQVEPIPPKDLVPKSVLLAQLIREAPEFLAYILAIQIPATNDRLRIPALMTQDKMQVETNNSTAMANFLKHRCAMQYGALTSIADFHAKLLEYIQEYAPGDTVYWTKHRVSQNMPPHFPKGRSTKHNGAWYFGNLKLLAAGELAQETPVDIGEPKFVLDGEILRPEVNHHA